MNTRNFWIAVLSGAVLTTLVSNLPFVGFINCLLFAGFWGSAIFAVWLYRRLGGTLTVMDGVKVGALSGLVAWFIGFLLSFAGLAGIQGMLSGAGQFLGSDAAESMQDMPAWAPTLINLLGVVVEVGFGAVGGWIGGTLFRTDRGTQK